VQMVKRHTRPNPQRQIKGGIAERERPIAVSNLMIVCPTCGPARIGHKVEQSSAGKARRTRICRKCGAPLEKK
jgi:large subunit ribosomal protein L24